MSGTCQAVKWLFWAWPTLNLAHDRAPPVVPQPWVPHRSLNLLPSAIINVQAQLHSMTKPQQFFTCISNNLFLCLTPTVKKKIKIFKPSRGLARNLFRVGAGLYHLPPNLSCSVECSSETTAQTSLPFHRSLIKHSALPLRSVCLHEQVISSNCCDPLMSPETYFSQTAAM